MASLHYHYKDGQTIPFSVQYSYGLSRAVATVNGKQIQTEWIYRNETYTFQEIRALIDQA